MSRYLKFALFACSLLPGFVNATPMGFYIGGEFVEANTKVSRINSSEVTPSIYSTVGSMTGNSVYVNGVSYKINNIMVASIVPGSAQTNVKDRVSGAHIYLGYQVLNQLAFELGYLYLRDQTSNYTANTMVNTSGTITNSVNTISNLNFNSVTRTNTYNEKAIDLNMKAIVPINHYFNVYAKIGGAYLKTRSQSSTSIANPNHVVIGGISYPVTPVSFTTSTSSTPSKIYPGLGVGISYLLSDNTELNGSWYRIISKGNNIGNIDMLALGLEYHIGCLGS